MSGVTSLDAAGKKFIAGWEGGQSPDGLYHAYWDEYGHVWTIGVGETHDVRPGEVWTQEQAFEDLNNTFARNYAPSINALNVDMNQNQFNGLGDYLWNCGAAALEVYGVAPFIKEGDWRGAATAIMKPDTSGGVFLQDLYDRRKAESALLLTPVPKPTPVDPYALYPKTVEHFDGKVFDEYRLAKRIDAGLRHPRLDHRELKADLPLAKAAKTRIWVVSVYEPPTFKTKRPKPDWSDGRGPRYQLWSKRIEVMEKVLA